MPDPYRDPELECPACKHPLREFQTRLVCDGCDGMFLGLADLGGAIRDLTGVVPRFEYDDEAPGRRACPHCRHPMTTFKLVLAIDDEVVKPRPELDRCAAHGIWFDGVELARVFEKVTGKGPGGGVDRVGPRVGPRGSGMPSSSAGWRDRSGVPEWWGGFGGRGRG